MVSIGLRSFAYINSYKVVYILMVLRGMNGGQYLITTVNKRKVDQKAAVARFRALQSGFRALTESALNGHFKAFTLALSVLY